MVSRGAVTVTAEEPGPGVPWVRLNIFMEGDEWKFLFFFEGFWSTSG